MDQPIKFKWLWTILSISCVLTIGVIVAVTCLGSWALWKAGNEPGWWLDRVDGQQRIQVIIPKTERSSANISLENRKDEDGVNGGLEFHFGSVNEQSVFDITFGDSRPHVGAREVPPSTWLLATLGFAILPFCLLSIAVAVFVRRTVCFFKRGVYFSDDVLRPLKTAARTSIFLWLLSYVIKYLPSILINHQYPPTEPSGFGVNLGGTPGLLLTLCLILNVLHYILKMAKHNTEELRQIV